METQSSYSLFSGMSINEFFGVNLEAFTFRAAVEIKIFS